MQRDVELRKLKFPACVTFLPRLFLLFSSQDARVVEWQTRTFEGRMP